MSEFLIVAPAVIAVSASMFTSSRVAAAEIVRAVSKVAFPPPEMVTSLSMSALEYVCARSKVSVLPLAASSSARSN